MMANIIAFGEVMMRMEVADNRLLSQGQSLHYSFSGTGVNVAAAMVNFGHQGYLATRLPRQPLGQAAFAFMQKLGIQHQFIKMGGSELGMYFLEKGYGRRPSRVTYTERKNSSFNTAIFSEAYLNELAECADVLHLCGITLAMGESIRQQLMRLTHKVKQKGGLICFDCNFRPSLWSEEDGEAKRYYEEMFHLADIVMMNEKDALLTLQYETAAHDRRQQLEELIPQVAECYDIPVIAGTHRTVHVDNTHSLQGFLYKESSFSYAKTPPFAVLDRIGSGDAYTSGILHGELSRQSPQEEVQFAVTACMLACTIQGDTPLSTEDDIVSAINQYENDLQR
ncbi:sugar kinase [Bacillaceae bacterium SIJ1]|uniref:sugar kinase n=1 Tax=Litoribacterium kuwaitense TaxID=1398745 RepID=UPI0013EDFD88|nr:sugar kinase [Litoribacterium kuwaitense]NGP46905.1 sugar kinase [Litoribacterium kuwaitense]